MRSLARAIDRFCIKHPRFGIPNLMLYIIIGNAVVYIFGLMDTTNTLMNLLRFSPADIFRGQIWRLVSFVFIPQYSDIRSVFWLAIFLYLYYYIGGTLEGQWGTAKFTLYYLMSAVLLIVAGFILYFIEGIFGYFAAFYVNAYYINLTLFFAFATLYPDARMMLMMIIPVKAWWLGAGMGVYFLYEVLWTLRFYFPLNLLPLVVLITYFIFCGGYLMDYLRPRSRATGKTAINFKRAAKKVNRETKSKPYNRKCAVCGKTDTDYPDLEFRYCSRCEGYHCFCLAHIDNHVHFDR